MGVQGILSGRIDEAEKAEQITRYANYPVFSLFFTIYYVIKEKGNIFFRLFMITFFAMMPVIGQTRSAIISPAIAIIAFFINPHIYLKSIITYIIIDCFIKFV